MNKVECFICGWEGVEDDLLPWLGLSGMDAGCPTCGNDDIADMEEIDNG